MALVCTLEFTPHQAFISLSLWILQTAVWCNTSYPKRRAQMTLCFSSGDAFRLGKDTPYLKLVHCFESDIFKPQTDTGDLPKPGTSCYIMQYLGSGSFVTHVAACGDVQNNSQSTRQSGSKWRLVAGHGDNLANGMENQIHNHKRLIFPVASGQSEQRKCRLCHLTTTGAYKLDAYKNMSVMLWIDLDGVGVQTGKIKSWSPARRR